MKTVHVDLGPRSYDVLIGRGLLKKVGNYVRSEPLLLTGTPVIITDHVVARHYFDQLAQTLYAKGSNFHFRLSSGEQAKSLVNPSLNKIIQELKATLEETFAIKKALPESLAIETVRKHLLEFAQAYNPDTNNFKDYADILSELARERISRSGIIIALGGGVIGDLAGFVAATYLRGIDFVQVPTSLLAMVDSSVGGKTGVNLPEGKNLVGAFYQPKLVVADLDTLKTLPATEFSAGMAEVIKYGAIKDKVLFDRVTKGVKPDDSDLDEIIEKCVAIKARIVENDEFETKGQRALLNFGHTIGHAIEKATKYQTYLHGEAIAVGMVAAAWISHWHPETNLSRNDIDKIKSALSLNNLPIRLKKLIDPAFIYSALGNDKKVAKGKNHWVLLKGIGEAVSGCEIEWSLVEKAMEEIQADRK